MQCEAQKKYLVEVLESLILALPEILTPLGALHINSTESLHAILRRYREKGTKWAAVRCFLGENFGFLHWQRIQMAFWSVRTNPRTDFARLIKDQLAEAVRGKDERIGEAFRKKRAAYRAKVEGFTTTGKEGLAYRSGGTEGALQADLVARGGKSRSGTSQISGA